MRNLRVNFVHHGIAAFLALLLVHFLPAPGILSQEKAAGASNPVVITAGPEWIRLDLELDIVPGSALDFSGQGLQDPPAGKYGRVIARPDGQFAFEKRPAVPQRFYGVNLCFGAQYLSHKESDRLAERFARLGYNTVRLHHYEGTLAEERKTTTSFDRGKLDQLDYLMYALIRRGIYVTTDLFTSRPVMFREIGVDKDGPVGMDHFKVLVPVHEGAWENWKLFSRMLLDHVNPYTGRRWADEPALAWISLINEGNFGNFIRDIRTIAEWQQAWNSWLAKRYSHRQALADAWDGDLKDGEDFSSGTVPLQEFLNAGRPKGRDILVFFAETEVAFTRRMKSFLRDELGCKALITNTNSWTNHVTGQQARMLYDYVDDHFYVDHPNFLGKPWQLPSRCQNTSPVLRGAFGGRDRCFTRLFDKPFTVTEYDYCGPGRFRAVGGILTGALGALQGWGGIWRFAYSHNRESLFSPARMDYFDLASDPLGQASERASLCLFLRRDMATAPHSLAIGMTPGDLESPKGRVPLVAPRWNWAAWVTRVGTQVLDDPAASTSLSALLPLAWNTPVAAYAKAAAVALNPYDADDEKIVELLRERGIAGDSAAPDPAKLTFRSETGQMTLDGPNDIMILDTLRTAGGYAPAGRTIQTHDNTLSVTLEGSDATIWVSSLDGRPIRQSRRLLVTHLTDLQNTKIKYAEEARQTLLDWGEIPHLVRAGKATVRIALEGAGKYKVWALSTSGRRMGGLKTAGGGGFLQFQADVSGGLSGFVRMFYEIARC